MLISFLKFVLLNFLEILQQKYIFTVRNFDFYNTKQTVIQIDQQPERELYDLLFYNSDIFT